MTPAINPPVPDSLVITNQIAEVPRMSAWVQETLKHKGISDQFIFNFDLCANEAVTNIISYAFPDNGPQEICLRFLFEGDTVRLEIEDGGIPFNPLEVPDRRRPATLDEARIGGLGILLMRKFMDECGYARREDKNCLTLHANLPVQRQDKS